MPWCHSGRENTRGVTLSGLLLEFPQRMARQQWCLMLRPPWSINPAPGFGSASFPYCYGTVSLKGEDAAVLLETGIFLYKHKNLLKTRKRWCPQCGFRAEKMPLKGLGVWWSQAGEAFVFWPLWGRFPAGAFRIREPEGNFQKPPWTTIILFKVFHLYFYCWKMSF